MKSKFASFIMTIVIILIIAVFALFGLILWDEFVDLKTIAEPENVKTVIADNINREQENINTPQIVDDQLGKIQNENTNQNVDYSDVIVDKYFYNQLEEYSKIIYKAFETNKENMKSGTYKIELGNSFSPLLKQEDGQEQLGKYYQSAIEAYTYDNPDVFYLSPNKMYLNIETTTRGSNTTYYVYINNGSEPNYLISEYSSKEQINKDLESIEQVRDQILQNKKSDTYENIKMVHDYLVENTEYDTSLSKDNIYNIYGAMINKQAVCEGYARSFKYLMDAIGIPCTVVIGKGTNSEGKSENHAWNYVQVDNNWYAVDTTWDDPVSNTGWVSSLSKRHYFLKGSNTMSKDHEPSGQFTDNGKIFTYPELSISDY